MVNQMGMAKERSRQENCRLVLTLLRGGKRANIQDAKNLVYVRGRPYLLQEEFHEGHRYDPKDVEEILNYACKVHAVARRITVDYETDGSEEELQIEPPASLEKTAELNHDGKPRGQGKEEDLTDLSYDEIMNLELSDGVPAWVVAKMPFEEVFLDYEGPIGPVYTEEPGAGLSGTVSPEELEEIDWDDDALISEEERESRKDDDWDKDIPFGTPSIVL